MPKKEDTRLSVGPLGEIYNDALVISAWMTGRTKPMQATLLLCLKLQELELKVERQLKYLAQKRGIDKDEMRARILRGEAKLILPEEVLLPSELFNDKLDESNSDVFAQ